MVLPILMDLVLPISIIGGLYLLYRLIRQSNIPKRTAQAKQSPQQGKELTEVDKAKKEKEERERFIKLHEDYSLPVDREQLLSFGALMFLRNKEYTSILYVGANKDNLRKSMAKNWGIVDAETARHTIQAVILAGRRSSGFQTDFEQIQQGAGAGQLQSMSAEDYVRWEQAKAIWKQKLMPDSSITSLSAFDYERIAYVARVCHYLGYIADEVWPCLAWVAKQSKQEFAEWKDYAASFVFGRAASFADIEKSTVDCINSAKALLTAQQKHLNRPHIWQRYPLAEITVPKDIVMPEYKDVNNQATRLPASAQLLGFGALCGRAYDDLINNLVIISKKQSNDTTWLAETWNIANEAGTTERIEWLIKNGSREKYGDLFSQIAQGTPLSELENVPAAEYLRFQNAAGQLVQSGVSESVVKNCRSMLAYDMERAAYILRIAVAVGYIKEDVAWNYLRRISNLSCGYFTSWQDYCSSFVLAQALFNNNPQTLEKFIRAGVGLLNVESPFEEFVSPWRRYPLQNMQVMSAVKNT